MNGALERITKLIADEFGVDPATITEATELDALGLDILDRVEFAIELPHGMEDGWKTVRDVVVGLVASK
jgi:acyl carrier protein